MSTKQNRVLTYSDVELTELSNIYTNISNGAICPVCKQGNLTFLATDDNKPSVSFQEANFLNTEEEIETINFPIYTLICNKCTTMQTVNAPLLFDKIFTEDDKNG